LLSFCATVVVDKSNTTQYYIYDYQGNRVRTVVESNNQAQSQRKYLPLLDLSTKQEKQQASTLHIGTHILSKDNTQGSSQTHYQLNSHPAVLTCPVGSLYLSGLFLTSKPSVMNTTTLMVALPSSPVKAVELVAGLAGALSIVFAEDVGADVQGASLLFFLLG
jgi:hypothetical protein